MSRVGVSWAVHFLSGIENRRGTEIVITRPFDPPTHVSRHIRHLREGKPASLEAFIICGERFSGSPVHAEHEIQVLSMIAVGMNYRAGDLHRGQSPSNHVNTGLFKHFSDGTVGRVVLKTPVFTWLLGDW